MKAGNMTYQVIFRYLAWPVIMAYVLAVTFVVIIIVLTVYSVAAVAEWIGRKFNG
jgi:hypothetical protein